MSSTTKNPTRGYMILALDFLLFLALIKLLPFTPMENRGLALLIFIGILWLTEAFNITVTSLMVPILAIGLNVLPTKAAFAPFSEPIIFMFFGGFVLAAVMNIQKLDLWIANHIIRLARGNLKLTVLYLFAATAGLSLFINNTAVAAMMLPLTLGILKKVDLKTNRALYVFVLLGVAFSASIGGIGTLTGSAPNAILASQLKITFSEWLFYGIPVAILLMIGMVFSLLVVLRPNFNVPFEISSMGIRVDKNSLEKQLQIEDKEDRKELYFHKRLLNNELPLTIGGGIGQSRLCMFLLQKAHIGEIQASIWPEEMREKCKAHNIPLI